MSNYGKRMVPEPLLKRLEELNSVELPIKLDNVSNIAALTDEEINSLEAGDIVVKKTGNQKHAYIVTYKEDKQGICLTYADATYIETVSYDYTAGHWVYNSKDSIELQPKLTAGDNITITDGVISATDTKYTAGTNITITDGVISAAGGTKYKHAIYIGYTGSQSSAHIFLNIETDDNTLFTKDSSNNTFAQYLYNKGITSRDKAIQVSGTYYINSEAIERPVLCLYANSQNGFGVLDIKAADNTEVIHTFSGTGGNIDMRDNLI